MKNSEAVSSGLISEDHPYVKDEKSDRVIFKKDLITIFKMNGNDFDYDFEEIDLDTALNFREEWL